MGALRKSKETRRETACSELMARMERENNFAKMERKMNEQRAEEASKKKDRKVESGEEAVKYKAIWIPSRV